MSRPPPECIYAPPPTDEELKEIQQLLIPKDFDCFNLRHPEKDAKTERLLLSRMMWTAPRTRAAGSCGMAAAGTPSMRSTSLRLSPFGAEKQSVEKFMDGSKMKLIICATDFWLTWFVLPWPRRLQGSACLFLNSLSDA